MLDLSALFYNMKAEDDDEISGLKVVLGPLNWVQVFNAVNANNPANWIIYLDGPISLTVVYSIRELQRNNQPFTTKFLEKEETVDQHQDIEDGQLEVFYEDLRGFYMEMIDLPIEDGVEIVDLIDRIKSLDGELKRNRENIRGFSLTFKIGKKIINIKEFLISTKLDLLQKK